MKYIQLTQGKQTLVDDEDFEYLNQWKWAYEKRYNRAVRSVYIKGSGRKNQKNDTWLMHRLIMNVPANKYIDHINGNTLDNRKQNLRICTHAQNMLNKKQVATNNTSGFKGVSWNKHAGRWMSKINIHRKQLYIGLFDTKEEAALAYNKMALKLHGEFANVNTITTP